MLCKCCTKILIFSVMILFLCLSSCLKEDTYRAFLYPNKNDLYQHIEEGPFDSAQGARSWIFYQVEQLGLPPGSYDYEIGKNCKKRDFGSIWVCEDTFR